MFFKNLILRAERGTRAAFVLPPLQPLRAQTSSDSERLEKLERAVEQLQKRNAELESEIRGLKQRTAFAPEFDAEGNKKPKISYDGKTYVEKPAPVEEKKPVYAVARASEIKL